MNLKRLSFAVNGYYRPKTSPTEQEYLDGLVQAPLFNAVRNDRDVQCVRFADGTPMAAFYTPGDVALSGKPVLSVDKPCLALWSEKELFLCDPTNTEQGVPVQVMWRGKTYSTMLPEGGKVLHLP